MGIAQLGYGRNIPNDVNVMIEIPAFSSPVKYEVDKDNHTLSVDRFIATAMQYPANYGYIPETLSEDGDPIDVLVITPVPLVHGCIIRCRVIGMLNMTDDAGKDAKLLALPISKLTPIYNNIMEPKDLPKLTLNQIEHFFKHYKDLEPGKWVKIEGWEGPKLAEEEIIASVGRYNGSAS